MTPVMITVTTGDDGLGGENYACTRYRYLPANTKVSVGHPALERLNGPSEQKFTQKTSHKLLFVSTSHKYLFELTSPAHPERQVLPYRHRKQASYGHHQQHVHCCHQQHRVSYNYHSKFLIPDHQHHHCHLRHQYNH